MVDVGFELGVGMCLGLMSGFRLWLFRVEIRLGLRLKLRSKVGLVSEVCL